MTALENTQAEIRYFKQGSVEEFDSIQREANLDAALISVRRRIPEAAFLRCCEHEPDGGCVFIYPNPSDLERDQADASEAETADALPKAYGRWVGIISSAEREEPTCERPGHAL